MASCSTSRAARCRSRSATWSHRRRSRAERRGDPAPLGRELRFHRGPAHRQRDHQGERRILSPSAQHHPVHAGQPRRLRRQRAPRACRDARAGALRARARLAQLDHDVRARLRALRLQSRLQLRLFNFATNDLSAFYFDIRKDALYCDPKSSTRRRAARTSSTRCSTTSSPGSRRCSCFTMEEAWTTRYGVDDSVHLHTLPGDARGMEERGPARQDLGARARSPTRRHRRARARRAAKEIGSSLEAAPTLYVESTRRMPRSSRHVDLAEIAITSGARVEIGQGPAEAFRLPDVAGAAVVFAPADGRKCGRCWMVLPEVGTVPAHPDLCRRCSRRGRRMSTDGPARCESWPSRPSPPTRSSRTSCSMASTSGRCGPFARVEARSVPRSRHGVEYAAFPMAFSRPEA